MKEKKRDFDTVCKAIALRNGISVEEVKKEIQSALDCAYRNPTERQKQFQSNIPKKGEVPTAEEFFYFISENMK